jgi:hypothetical protein
MGMRTETCDREQATAALDGSAQTRGRSAAQWTNGWARSGYGNGARTVAEHRNGMTFAPRRSRSSIIWG